MSQNHWDDPEKRAADESSPAHDARVGGEQPHAALPHATPPKSSKEWKLIEKMVSTLHVEHRRARRWGIFFKLLTFTYLFALLGIYLAGRYLSPDVVERGNHVAVIEVSGVIADSADANADVVITSLRNAFSAKNSEAVILRINSPGGSPVQAGYINDEIKRLRALHPEKKTYAVITDIGASGAYYVAVAADEIYADKASLVGSIGVTASSFGFVELLDKVGVERRTMTAGENKAFLDPFQPLKEEDKAFWQTVLDTTHRQFVQQVIEGRGDRLKDDPSLFTGLVWSGEQALELGLIDGLGSTSSVARDIIQNSKLVNYTFKPSPLDRLADRLSMSIASQLASQLSARLIPELQ